ncbi:hypothetical protein [Natronomonas sp.]|jgi:hypothetical protein|uniref:hypothetical protein n=1 Tax=Natronomonas sp. TaxID=2184060 RepID=UPI003989B896
MKKRAEGDLNRAETFLLASLRGLRLLGFKSGAALLGALIEKRLAVLGASRVAPHKSGPRGI